MKCRFFTQRSFLLASIFFLSIKLFAQDGFNKRYGAAFPATVFYNLIADGDSLVVYGIGVDSQQFILCAKFDTLGNLLQSTKIRDSLGRNFYSNLNYDIIKTSGGNYGIVGEVGSPQTTFWMEVSPTLHLVHFAEFTDPEVAVSFLGKMKEENNGFILLGSKQNQSYASTASVLKIDLNGNLLFEKDFIKPSSITILFGITRSNTLELVISAARTNPQGTQLPNWWAQSWIFAIDSLGNKLWEFEGPVNDETEAVGIQQTTDGNWLYGSADFDLIGNNEWGRRTKIVCRDPQWNLLWQTNISPTVYSTNRIRDIVPAHDGNYIVIGEWTTPQTPGEANYGGGCIVKINPEGDTLWTRLFTGFPTQPKGTANYLGGVAVLPSGSIVAAGYARRFHPTSIASQGWVIKISPDGCVVDTLCITTPTIEPARASTSSVSVFPNPAQTQVTFALPPGSDPARVRLVIWDAFGREVWSFAGSLDPEGLPWTPQNLPAGVYFWKIDGELRQSGRLVWGE